jgi:uncharacterized protein
MRRYLILFLALICACSIIGCDVQQPAPAAGNALYKSERTVTLPEPTGYVVDTISLLNAQTKATIEERCKAFDAKVQLAVCIVSTTSPLSLEDYSIKLAEKWQVGHKGLDNGVILLIAQSDRKLRIEVGRGLESKITDSKAGEIINNIIVPYFKAGDFNKGILMGVSAILTEADR